MPTRDCPVCGHAIASVDGYPEWCDACDWNIVAPFSSGAATWVDRRLALLVGRLDERSARAIAVSDDARARKPTPSLVAAYAIALVTHLLTLALVAGGVLLLVRHFPNPFAIGAGIIGAGLGVAMRPRLGRVPTDGVVARERAPELYALVDDVAAVLGTRPPQIIVVDGAFNASWATVGLRRRRVLTLGLPLLVGLEPQERVALIAHELGHGRNGDSSRSLVVGSAVQALTQIVRTLEPDPFSGQSLIDLMVRTVTWVVAKPFQFVLWLETALFLRNSQRAEYLADRRAAEVAGTAATVGLHEKLLLVPLAEGVVRRAVALLDYRRQTAGLLDEVRSRIIDAPERERERRRRVAKLEDVRLEVTHPPTARRIRLLEDRPDNEPAVVLTADRAKRIEAELRPVEERVCKELADAYLGALYH
jgi:Zn-dependent protease with chaperone function